MRFEWDPEKNTSNLSKHGINFVAAAKVFHAPRRIELDSSKPEYGESRIKAIGIVESTHMTVIYTDRGEVCRIISARRSRIEDRGSMNDDTMITVTKSDDGSYVQILPDGSIRPIDDRTDWARLNAMTDEEIEANALGDPDNPPLTDAELARMRRVPNPREIRTRLNLTQEQFAKRFHLRLGTIRDWEQGKKEPDSAARALLRVIDREPEAVDRALTG